MALVILFSQSAQNNVEMDYLQFVKKLKTEEQSELEYNPILASVQ